MLRENLVDAEGNPPNVGPRDARLGIEIDAELIGMIDIRSPYGPRVEIDAAEVDGPHDVGNVDGAELARDSSAREGDGDGLQPVGLAVRYALLEEELSGGAVGVPLQHGGPGLDTAQRALAHREVVLDEVELGLAPLRKEDLLRIRYAHGVPIDVEVHMRTGHDPTVRGPNHD